MARILTSNDVLTSRIARVVEFPSDYVVNGAVYTKSSFSPVSCKFVNTATNLGSVDMFSMKSNLYLGSNGVRPNSTGYVMDSFNSDVSFHIFSSPTSGQCIRRYIKDSEGNILQTHSYAFVASLYTTANVVYQDEYNIYILAHGSSNILYLYSLTKNTLSTVANYSLGGLYTEATLVKVSYPYLFFSVRTNNTGFNITRIDTSLKTSTVIFSHNTSASCFRTVGKTTDLSKRDYFYSLRDSYDTTSAHNGSIFKYSITSATTATYKEVSIDYSLVFPYSADRRIPIVNSNYGAYDLFEHTDNGLDYVSLFIYPPGESAALDHSIQWFNARLYTFRIISPNQLKLISYIDFSSNYVSGFEVIKGQTNTTLLIANSNNLTFYSWDKTNKTFKEISTSSVESSIIGIDSLNDVWVLGKDASVEWLSIGLPSQFYVGFSEESYYFNGSDISTSVKAYVENHLGKKVSVNVEISLIGNAAFVENGSKKIIKTTNSLDELILPIVIKGRGEVSLGMRMI